MSEESKSPIMTLLIGMIKEIIAYKIAMLKKKAVHMCVAMSLTFAAMIAIIFGLGAFVSWLFPILPAGIGHLIVGFVFLIAALIAAKTA
ncbi:MAG: hypothetical protein PHH26_07070 [Candidatus Thermoplasmatota archaeon]|nr:hypothetical protein [Candidatus Thermoplasmatota archaeon]